ncbi:MAG TPA: SCO family protein [Rhodocyclaceae bacterium]|nr:SCO family protein [Rhodocyclaceae bacterium]
MTAPALRAFVVLAAAAIAGHAAAQEVSANDIVAPRYLLQAPGGQVVTDSDFPGRFQLITFGYTFCPDVCPTTLAAMTMALKELGEQARFVQPIFITVDPERDTLPVLGRYTEFFDSRILGLTGSADLVHAAADHFHVTYRKFLEPGKPADRYAVDHTAGMFVLGPDGGYVTRFAYSTPPGEVAARLRKLIADLPPPAKH